LGLRGALGDGAEGWPGARGRGMGIFVCCSVWGGMADVFTEADGYKPVLPARSVGG